MKILTFTIFLITTSFKCLSQVNDIQNFRSLNKESKRFYNEGKTDSLLNSSKKQIKLAHQIKNDSFICVSYKMMGNQAYLNNNYTTALEYNFKALRIAENIDSLKFLLTQFYNNIGYNYYKLRIFDKSIMYFKKAEANEIKYNKSKSLPYVYENIAELFFSVNKIDSAKYYLNLADNKNLLRDKYIQIPIYVYYGKIAAKLNDFTMAANYFEYAKDSSSKNNDYFHLCDAHYEISKLNLLTKKIDLAKYNALTALRIANEHNYFSKKLNIYDILNQLYIQKQNKDSAYYYLNKKWLLKEKIERQANESKLLSLSLIDELNEIDKKNKSIREKIENKIYTYYSYIFIILLSLILLFFVMSNTYHIKPIYIKYYSISLLFVLFESINLFLDPLVESVSDNNPLIKLSILIILALLITTVNKYVSLFTSRILEKYKTKRLTMAKNIINEEGIKGKV
jgi:tetratricopeptide (TPR) repeat protein